MKALLLILTSSLSLSAKAQTETILQVDSVMFARIEEVHNQADQIEDAMLTAFNQGKSIDSLQAILRKTNAEYWGLVAIAGKAQVEVDSLSKSSDTTQYDYYYSKKMADFLSQVNKENNQRPVFKETFRGKLYNCVMPKGAKLPDGLKDVKFIGTGKHSDEKKLAEKW